MTTSPQHVPLQFSGLTGVQINHLGPALDQRVLKLAQTAQTPMIIADVQGAAAVFDPKVLQGLVGLQQMLAMNPAPPDEQTTGSTSCQQPDCTKLARQGAGDDCRTHTIENGQMPAASKACQHPGCGKLAVKSRDGVCVFCVSHMKLYGLQPRVSRPCQHVSCYKHAEKDSSGLYRFCVSHMRQYGVKPNYGKQCQHPECSKYAQRSNDGQYKYCKAHMSQHGMSPKVITICSERGCAKEAVARLRGRSYCALHSGQQKVVFVRQTGEVHHADASDQELVETSAPAVASFDQQGILPNGAMLACNAGSLLQLSQQCVVGAGEERAEKHPQAGSVFVLGGGQAAASATPQKAAVPMSAWNGQGMFYMNPGSGSNNVVWMPMCLGGEGEVASSGAVARETPVVPVAPPFVQVAQPAPQPAMQMVYMMVPCLVPSQNVQSST